MPDDLNQPSEPTVQIPPESVKEEPIVPPVSIPLEPPPGVPPTEEPPKPAETPIEPTPPSPPSPPSSEEPPLVISTPPKKSRVKVILASIVLLILLVSVPTAVYLVQQRQEIRKEAAGRAVLLGRVVNTGPEYSSCHEQRYYYGDNCGNTQCHGAPNYTVTWTQGDRSETINNNDCYPQNGPSKPRYTFEWTNNPTGDIDGEEITVSISVNGDIPLREWQFSTTDSNGNALAGSNQSGTFANPGPNQTVTVRVYRKDDYQWNHLWFHAFTPTPTPTPTPTSTPTPTPTKVLVCVDLAGTPNPSGLSKGDKITLSCTGTSTPDPINHFEFRVGIDGGTPAPLPNASATKTDSEYEGKIDYTIPDYGCYKVECRACVSADSSNCTVWGQASKVKFIGPPIPVP